MTPTREPSVTAPNEAAETVKRSKPEAWYRKGWNMTVEDALRTERLRVVEQVRAQGHPAGCTVSGCHLESGVAGLTGEEPSE